jgi:hypothetical protein
VDSEPHLSEKLKVIRDKKERFFETKKMMERGGIAAWESRVKPATGG